MWTLRQDIRFSLRMLGKNPGVTLVAVVTLALGIGANTAMFSVVNGVLLRPLPFPEPERIVEISRTHRGQFSESNFNAQEFDFWKQHREPFEYLAADAWVGFTLVGGSQPERIKALRVSTEYFHVLGVRPALGRDFLPSENQLGGPNVAVLSDGLWKREFSADPRALGRTILLDGAPYTIVGIMPPGFQVLPPVGLWTTIGQVAKTMGVGGNYGILGRLKPEISRQQADSYFATLAGPYFKQFAQSHGLAEEVANEMGLTARPYRQALTRDQRKPLLVLFGAIGFVLLIACVNVANLQMARAARRHKEVAIRSLMGAGKSQILRQLLTENVLLALLGAALGLIFAEWALHFLIALTPTDLPRAAEISLDGRALGFTALVAVLVGILFGLAPALQAWRTDLNESLKESGGRGATARHRLGGALVAGEVALSLVLLVGSGLLIATFANLLRTSPGFDPSHVLSLQIWTTGAGQKSSEDLAVFYRKILERIEAVPGVEKAGIIAGGLPLERGGNTGVRLLSQKDSKWFSSDYREISPDYFRAMGVPLLEGRFFTDADSTDAAKVVIINAALAREKFPGRNPIGEHVAVFEFAETEREIVGVVGDVKSYLNQPAPESIFIPVAQASLATDQLFQGWLPICVIVRTAGRPMGLSHPVASALRHADPNLPIGEVRAMDQVLSQSIASQRFLMTLMTFFGTMALALAGVGMFGVISYSVSQRTHEVGVRMALGATRGKVLAMIVWQGLRLALAGTAIGLAGAFALDRVLGSMLFGVQPTDPATLAAASLALILVALAACYLPARRATQVNPMVALRYE
jgi:putative ABC transport system permease protein